MPDDMNILFRRLPSKNDMEFFIARLAVLIEHQRDGVIIEILHIRLQFSWKFRERF